MMMMIVNTLLFTYVIKINSYSNVKEIKHINTHTHAHANIKKKSLPLKKEVYTCCEIVVSFTRMHIYNKTCYLQNLFSSKFT